MGLPLQTAVDEGGGAGPETFGLGVEVAPGGAARPVNRQQASRQAGVAEEELSPFVHEPAPGGESGPLVGSVPGGTDDLPGFDEPVLVGPRQVRQAIQAVDQP